MTLINRLRRLIPLVVVIEHRTVDGMRGSWDYGPGTISLAPGQEPCEEQIVLMHELIHAADDLSGASGEPRLSHADVFRLAPVLVALLAAMGMWGKFTLEDVKAADRRIRTDPSWQGESDETAEYH